MPLPLFWSLHKLERSSGNFSFDKILQFLNVEGGWVTINIFLITTSLGKWDALNLLGLSSTDPVAKKREYQLRVDLTLGPNIYSEMQHPSDIYESVTQCATLDQRNYMNWAHRWETGLSEEGWVVENSSVCRFQNDMKTLCDIYQSTETVQGCLIRSVCES